MSENAIPYGYCQCGCGTKTPLATHTKTDQGIVRGQPVRFIRGHQFRRHVEDQKADARERDAAKGSAPLCACECGLPVTAKDKKGNWSQCRKGHASRIRGGKYAKKAIGERYTHPRSGYVFVYVRDHPRTDSAGRVQEHILVMEKKLGRYLLPGEEVDHQDHDRTNNDPSNLVLRASSSEHRKSHWTRDGDHRFTSGVCGQCGAGTQVYTKRGICPRCAAINRWNDADS